MYKLKAEPLSNDDITFITQYLRKQLRCDSNSPLNILAILEYAMPELSENFNYSIKQQKDMRINAHAYTDPQTNEIVIREDIYERARLGEGRDRFTIAHEIGHYILHSNEVVALTRVYPDEKIKPYEDVEWQADAFAGELLCPSSALTPNLTIDEIADKYGVSRQAASAQKRKSLRCFQHKSC